TGHRAASRGAPPRARRGSCNRAAGRGGGTGAWQASRNLHWTMSAYAAIFTRIYTFRQGLPMAAPAETASLAVLRRAPLAPGARSAPDPRTRELIEAPIVRTLARLATPNVLVMLFQSSVGLIEAYFVGRLGTDALAGVTLVFPVL